MGTNYHNFFVCYVLPLSIHNYEDKSFLTSSFALGALKTTKEMSTVCASKKKIITFHWKAHCATHPTVTSPLACLWESPREVLTYIQMRQVPAGYNTLRITYISPTNNKTFQKIYRPFLIEFFFMKMTI